MLYHLLAPLADQHIAFNLFRYITFRAAGAMVTALILSFLLGPAIIRWLRALRFGQVIRTDGPERHLGKAGTPTMGGVLILIATAVSTLLWAELTNRYVLVALIVLLWMGALGFLDDYLKVVRRRTEGLVGRYKLIGQGLLGLLLGAFLLFWPTAAIPPNWTGIPFFADYHLVDLEAALHPVGHVRPGRELERGEPDGRAGRARGGALGDRGGDVRRLRLR